MLLFSLIISNCEDHVIFLLIHLTGVSCPPFKFSHLIKFCLPSQPECRLKSFLPLVPFFHQFRRQCVVNFIEYPLILSRSCSISSIYSRNAVKIISFLFILISFQPEWFQFLLVHCTRHSQLCNLQGSHGVPCFYFLPQCSQLCSIPLCSFFQLFNLLRFFGFTHLSKKQLSFTAYLPLPFPSGAILDLGTRSSCSGGVL